MFHMQMTDHQVQDIKVHTLFPRQAAQLEVIREKTQTMSVISVAKHLAVQVLWSNTS